jgi:tRNA dimethylallyltransferase
MSASAKDRVLLIAGPTAGGKSALALALAERFGGTVVNADSMQVYRELRILTARPAPEEEARLPHRLYGHVGAAEGYSVARWLAEAHREIAAALAAGRLPILVGGTGLYLSALTAGLAPVPELPEAVRAEARRLHAALGTEGLRARLAPLDPAGARPADPQRLIRAYEVVVGSGRPLAEWQRLPPEPPPLAAPWLGLVVAPPRPMLYRRCDARLQAMLGAGGLDEVRALAARGLPPTLPAMKALGLRELRRHLAGELDLATALAAAQTATRRYAKRQLTWLRHKMIAWKWLEAQETEGFHEQIFPFVSEFLLTGQR